MDELLTSKDDVGSGDDVVSGMLLVDVIAGDVTESVLQDDDDDDSENTCSALMHAGQRASESAEVEDVISVLTDRDVYGDVNVDVELIVVVSALNSR